MGKRIGLGSSRALCLMWLGFGVALNACSEDVQGPAPRIEPPSKNADPLPVDPGIVCRDQLTTELTIHGEQFSPIPIDIPKAPKVALPTLTWVRSHELTGKAVSDPDRVVYSGDPDKDPTNAFDAKGKPLVEWKNQTEMQVTINQALTLDAAGKRGMLEVGVWDLEIENANGKSAESPKSLAVVDKPEVSKVAPSLVCLAQGARTLTLSGETFLRNGDAEAVVDVEGSETPFELKLSDCDQIDHPGIDAEVCKTASVEFAKGSVEPGFLALDLHNPKTAACKSEEPIKLRVVPAPRIERVSPPLGCVTEDDRQFVIEGDDFLSVDGENPKVSVGDQMIAVDSMDGCDALETQGQDVQKCTSIHITLKKGSLAPDLYAVSVINPEPAGCDNVASGALRIVPPPALVDIVPPLVCLDDQERTVQVDGSDFLVVAGEAPSVKVDGEMLAASAVDPGSCSDLEVAGLMVQTCTSLTLTLAKDSAAIGMTAVEVTNPEPAGCSDSRSDLLTVVQGPEITSADPALLCTVDGSREIAIHGKGFITVGDELPAVEIDGKAVASVDSASHCDDVMVHGEMVQQCSVLSVTVKKNALKSVHPMVTVTNPDPAGCMATNKKVLAVPPELMIASVEPLNVCQGTVDAAFPLTIHGQGFLRVGSKDFTVNVAGADVTPTDIQDCTSLDVVGVKHVSSCDTIALGLNLTTAETGTAPAEIPIIVGNAQVAGCPLTAMTVLNVVKPPTVTSVSAVGSPLNLANEICSDKAITLDIVGTDFIEGASVKLVNDLRTVTADAVTVASDGLSVSAMFASGLPFDDSDHSYNLIVENAGNCGSTPLVDAILVDPTPLVFFVDPPVVYNGISVKATIFTSGLTAVTTTVDLLDDNNAVVTPLTGTNTALKPNRIQATIPANVTPGEYGIRVTSAIGCAGEAAGVLKVTDTTTIDLADIQPSFVSHTKATAVTITANDPAASGKVQFKSTPRAYLNPNPAGGAAVATGLRATVFVGATLMTAVVPENLPAGNYDLIVVNPTGEVGFKALALTVTTNEPPVIDSVVPASLVANTTTQMTLTGDGFESSGGNPPTLELECKAAGSSTTSAPIVGTGVNVSNGGKQAVVTFNTATATQGSVCIVRLSNPDGALFEYSAVSITNSSGNLATWVATTDMTVGRRALALTTGRTTSTSRFLYAIGGDTGVTNNAHSNGTLLDSVESANVDVFGTLGAWSVQRNKLPEVRNFAGAARIGSFIYLTGGRNAAAGNSATNTLYRAQVLDPLATPEISDLDATLNRESTGLGKGLWYYRVSALFPANDASNPSGESLPGEVLTVQLPERPGDQRIQLILTWSAIPGASGYRIYRSPTANGSVDALELVHEESNASTTSFTDVGDTTDSTKTPLTQGSLGMWHLVTSSPLNANREAHATVAVQDPNASSKWFLYAFGGRNEAGTYLSTYEYATVTVAGDGSQTVSTFQTVDGVVQINGDTPTKLSTARGELGAFVMTHDSASSVAAGDAWVFIGTGRDGSGMVNKMEAGRLDPDGHLGTLTLLSNGDTPNNQAGYGFGQANNQMFMFGGSNGNPSSGGNSAKIGTVPDLVSGAWNGLGSGAPTGTRVYMGSAQESAFFFLVGGHDGTSALQSTERTVQ
jgi:hypothetical protein